MKFFALILSVLIFGGCSLQQSTPSVTAYRLKPAAEISPLDGALCKEKTLRISLTQSPLLMQRQAIFYADESYVQYSYSLSRWAESPDKQLRHLLEEAIARNALFKSVVTYNSQAYNEWLLESKITDFMQYFEEETSYVHLAVELTLIDQDTMKVISTYHVEKRKATATADAKGAVEAFSMLVQEMLGETVEWLNGECR